ELAHSWNVVIVTSRDDSLRGPTLDWLKRRGFPDTPVVFSSRFLLSDKGRSRFKARAIHALLAEGLEAGWGIGDKASDMLAYRKNGLRTVLVLDGPRDADLDESLATLHVSVL